VPELRVPLTAAVHGFVSALEPWAAEHTYLNFAEGKRAAKTLWTEAALHRLRRIKAQVDPDNMIRSNHELV
jgi:FAD/FMN-containing dehydrogenase